MTTVLRQSTQVIVRIGSFVDSIDGVTPETGVTLGAADQAEALKAAGAATVDISGNTWAAITGADGWYNLTLSTTDTNTVGDLTIVVQDSSVCCPVHARFQVMEEALYDALYASGAAQVPANVVAWNGTAPNNLVSGRVDADMGAISTDATAADRLETMLDGTGGNVLTLSQLRINSAAAGGAIDIDNSNGPGISIGSTDHGIDIDSSVGNGIDILSDGPGLRIESDGSGDGVSITAASGGHGVRVQGGAGGDGIFSQGGTGSGNGITAQAQGGNSGGMICQGAGSGPGLQCLNASTGPGLLAQGGPTSGPGMHCVGSPSGFGDGILTVGGLNSGAGLRSTGVGGDPGILAAGGDASGIIALGNISGHGIEATGGINGHGVYALSGNVGGDGIRAESDTGGVGIRAIGEGANAGIHAVGGATGHGINALGGATSGDGIHAAAATLGDGIEAVGAGGGFDINADIQGSLSGSVGSVTGDVGGDVQGNLVGDVQGDVNGNLDGTLSVAALAQINGEVDQALIDIRLDELIQNVASPTTPTINSFLDRITSTDGTQTYDRSTDSLQSIRDALGGGGLTQQDVRDAMKLAPTPGAPAAGSVDLHLDTIEGFGAPPSVAAIDAQLSGTHGAGNWEGGGATDLTPVLNELDTIKGPGFNPATDSLEEVRDRIDECCGGGGGGDDTLELIPLS